MFSLMKIVNLKLYVLFMHLYSCLFDIYIIIVFVRICGETLNYEMETTSTGDKNYMMLLFDSYTVPGDSAATGISMRLSTIVSIR